MLLPQYSLRQILVVMAVLGVVSLVAVQAIKGTPWAFGVVFGLVALVFVLAMYGLAYALAILWGSLPIYRDRKRPPASQAGKVAGCLLAMFGMAATNNSAQAVTGFQITLPGWPIKQTPGGPVAIGVPTVPGQPPAVGLPGTPPTAPPANNSGLLLTLDSTWADGYGYRPVRITVTPVAPSTADRLLEIVLKPGWNYRASDLSVSQNIELPTGFNSVTKTIAVPQIGPSQQQLNMDVFEDGALVRELSLDMQYIGMGGSQFSGDNASPTVLSLGSNINDYPIFEPLNRGNQQSVKVGGAQVQSTSSLYMRGTPQRMAMYSQTGAIASITDLPDRWIDYSGLDVILASMAEVEQLAEQHPAKWEAIRRWVMTGGNLWVYAIDDALPPVQPQLAKQAQTPPRKPQPKWQHLADLNELVKFDDAAKPLSDNEEDKVRAGWREPDPARAYEQAPQPQYWGGPMATFPTTSVTQQPQYFDASGQPIPPAARFLLRELGHGMVAAISDPTPTNSYADPNNPDFRWNWLYASLGPDRIYWVARHGVSFQSPNDNYWYFLIPGVGAAPVGVFQLLITLFVIAIGPINYFLLKRWHKQNLILITVPLSAALITLALVSYAILSDGFGVRMQSRSITYLNQPSGEAACLGRLTYYAGLTPSSGLSFSSSTAVYPLEESPSGGRRDPGPTKSLKWVAADGGDEPHTQLLGSNWLQSRVQNQFVTVRARKTSAAIEVREHSSGSVEARNQLGTPIQYIALRDSAGNLYQAKDIGLNGTASLEKIDPAAVEGALREIGRQQRLAPPGEMREMRSRSIFDIRRTYHYRSYPVSIPGTQLTPQAPGLIETQLERALGFASSKEFGPRSFVAIVDRSPEQELGLDSADEESGFHVILGRW